MAHAGRMARLPGSVVVVGRRGGGRRAGAGYGRLSRCLLSTPKVTSSVVPASTCATSAGLEIRDCEVSGLKIVDCYGGNVYLGGGFERVVVNDVDVTAYVEAELDRQHPNAGAGA